mmetsp:Transcript_134749/g.190546  ORF Transcript_134749/g.190546 Transcript_134749/m.190546 type:complete len:90 (-) Transcript_134749:98-367(-)|eukprot:s98_g43.t1
MNLLLNLLRLFGTIEEKVPEPATVCHGFEAAQEVCCGNLVHALEEDASRSEKLVSPWVEFARRRGLQGSDEDWLAIQHAFDQYSMRRTA